MKLFNIALLTCAVTSMSGVSVANGGETTRLRAVNYDFDQVTSDNVYATASECGTARDTGLMEFALEVDQSMLDQFAAILDVNGTIEVEFDTQIGNAFAGNYARGTVKSEVLVNIDGVALPYFRFSSNASGTLPFSGLAPLTATEVSQMTVGSVITVTGSGSGTARTNGPGCDPDAQAIVSWDFTTSGKPLLKTYP